MPRTPTSDRNAEHAVAQYKIDLELHDRTLPTAWLSICKLLMTCKIWRDGGWNHLLGQPVVRESNDYKEKKDGSPNRALVESTLIGDYVATHLGVERSQLCSKLGAFLMNFGQQPNNLRGHAFRSIVAETLAKYGDQTLDIAEEVDPHSLFPGYGFHLRSDTPRIDIVVSRSTRVVALCSVRWTYRHDRVDMLEEAVSYMAGARRMNQNCRFFGITAEMNPARLKKVVKRTAPVERNAAMERLVHLHSPLATTVIGHNGMLKNLWSLNDWVNDSFRWH